MGYEISIRSSELLRLAEKTVERKVTAVAEANEIMTLSSNVNSRVKRRKRTYIEALVVITILNNFIKASQRNPKHRQGFSYRHRSKNELHAHNVVIIIKERTYAVQKAASLTALKLGIELGHVEAGLKSYDWRMPKEHNRRMIDHVSHHFFAPPRSPRKT